MRLTSEDQAMTCRYIVSLYAEGARRASDCLPDFYPTRSAAIDAGKDELARVRQAWDSGRGDYQIDWAVRFTVRKKG
jgi:hypothetical protein